MLLWCLQQSCSPNIGLHGNRNRKSGDGRVKGRRAVFWTSVALVRSWTRRVQLRTLENIGLVQLRTGTELKKMLLEFLSGVVPKTTRHWPQPLRERIINLNLLKSFLIGNRKFLL